MSPTATIPFTVRRRSQTGLSVHIEFVDEQQVVAIRGLIEGTNVIITRDAACELANKLKDAAVKLSTIEDLPL